MSVPAYIKKNFNIYNGLKLRQQDKVKIWCDVFDYIAGAPKRCIAVQQMFEKYGSMRGFSVANIDRKYDAWRSTGQDWRVALYSKVTPRKKPADLFEQVYKRYCEDAHQSSKQQWRRMMRDLALNKDLPPVGLNWKEVFRVEHPNRPLPAECPYSEKQPPRGCQYRRLQEYFGLTKFQEKAVRIGLAAARDHVLPVLTTRVGLQVGSVYQFDDMKHNVKVNFPGNIKAHTPLEFAAMDVFSGSRFAYGIRPTIEEIDAKGIKKRGELNEFEFRCCVAKVFCEFGYNPGGTIAIGEHGTAVFRPWLRELLTAASDGKISFADSAILNKQVHAGLYPGRSKGNFHVKACLESQHHLFQTATAHLPAQTGRNSRIDRPEQLTGLDKYNEQLLKHAGSELMRRDPERAAMLLLPAMGFNHYLKLIYELYDILDWRTDHTLEGFEEACLTKNEFRLAKDSNDWHDAIELLQMEPAQAAAINALIASDMKAYYRHRLMAPAEVFNAGKAALTKLSKWHVPDILGRDSGLKNKHVESKGLINFRDKYFGPGEHIYYGVVTTPEGFQQALSTKRKYIIHLNPLALDQAFIRDQENNAIIGIAERYNKACKVDEHAIHVLMGKQNHDMKVKSDEIAARHVDQIEERAAIIKHNKGVLSGAIATPTELAARSKAKAADGDLEDLYEFATAPAAPVEETEDDWADFESMF